MDGQSEKQKIFIQPDFELVEGGMNESVRPRMSIFAHLSGEWIGDGHRDSREP